MPKYEFKEGYKRVSVTSFALRPSSLLDNPCSNPIYTLKIYVEVRISTEEMTLRSNKPYLERKL